MSEAMLVHQLPYIHHRMDQISPMWPKKGVHISLDPQLIRMPLSQWEERVLTDVALVRQTLMENRFDTGSVAVDDRGEYDVLRHQDLILNELLAVLSLPKDVVAGARKRLFGDFAPVDQKGGILFSEKELNLIAGAMWGSSEHRISFMHLKDQAETFAMREKRVLDVFASLRKELL